MKKQVIYKYLGTNGTIESPVHLEDIYYVRSVRLVAETGKALTNGDRVVSSITVPEDEVDQWSEIESQGQE
jgi:hypothetical protein